MPHIYCQIFCIAAFFLSGTAAAESPLETSWSIPAAGNSFQRRLLAVDRRPQRDSRLTQIDADTLTHIYFHIDRHARIELDVEARTTGDAAAIQVTVDGQRRTLHVQSDAFTPHSFGSIDVNGPGYVRVELRQPAADTSTPQGTTPRESATVELKGLIVRSATEGLQVHCVATNEGNMFYWGRRGPSVHLGYSVPRDVAIEYAYSEITVAKGEDPIGSYFMANGFGEGYFGIQVNSATERRVLFSVWSPFSTDDPRKIPEDQRVLALAKGPEVRVGEFGNEGSGGQSYLVYPWESGRTYRFLTQVAPDGQGNTVYTSWFGDKAREEWRLIARFRRPKTDTHLRGFHSFLENFDPGTGDQMRRGQHGNIWVRDTLGNWHECLQARFTVDPTGQGGHRLDFDGGVSDGVFYLKNCGFFSGTRQPGTALERTGGSSSPPEIDLAGLPRD